MSKEIMTEEAFYELIENLKVVDKLTIYGKNAIKYWVLKLRERNEELEKNIDRLGEEQKEREKYVHSLEIKIQKLMKKNERKNKIINSKDRLIYITGIELRNAEKQIELMAEYIANISDCPAEIFNVNFACANRCNASIDKECWIKYFENKVEEE